MIGMLDILLQFPYKLTLQSIIIDKMIKSV
jgi:hypothetical protein